jgi:hypothetical protein
MEVDKPLILRSAAPSKPQGKGVAMTSDTTPEDNRLADVVASLRSGESASPEELRLALIYALDRIATLEKEWGQAKAAWSWFGREMKRINPGESI